MEKLGPKMLNFGTSKLGVKLLLYTRVKEVEIFSAVFGATWRVLSPTCSAWISLGL